MTRFLIVIMVSRLTVTAAPGRRLHFPEVGTIPKPRQAREFPELGLIVSQQKR